MTATSSDYPRNIIPTSGLITILEGEGISLCPREPFLSLHCLDLFWRLTKNYGLVGWYPLYSLESVKYFVDAGFRPGSRGLFVLAKGPKTIDALPGLMR